MERQAQSPEVFCGPASQMMSAARANNSSTAVREPSKPERQLLDANSEWPQIRGAVDWLQSQWVRFG